MRYGAVWLCVLVTALLVPMLGPVAAQPEAVTLRMPLRPGDAFFYTSTISSTARAEAAGNRQSFTVQLQGREAHRVLDVDGQGVALVEVMLEDTQISSGTTIESLPGGPTLMRVRSDGKVVERAYGDPLLGFVSADYPFPLPDRPVSVNDTWRRETTVEESGVTAQATAIFTLADLERQGEMRIARVSGQIEGTVIKASLGPLPPEAQARTNGKVHGRVDIDWLVDQGRLMRVGSTLTIDVQSDVKLGDQTLQLKLTSVTSASSIALSASALPTIAIAEEFLIKPGHGIGPHPLSVSLEELNNRLGGPTSRTMRDSYRAESVRWPGGLIAFVDPEDPAKIVGIEVADRKYRTEKDIGFGSSMGAALLGYGLAPKSIDLPTPGAKLLVYDDLGIAFGITTAEAHAAKGPEHAPVGAVDWVTVFPPGAASKIYTGR